MSSFQLDGEDYQYAGESVDVDERLSAEQHRACIEAMGCAAGGPTFSPERPFYEFEPETVDAAAALRAHLREHGISHSGEVRLSWTPSPERAGRAQALAELVALARRLEVEAGGLDEAIYDAEAPRASQINNEGTEAQIRWLLGVNDTATVRRLIEDAAGCAR
jgi:hypothetical protein